MSSRLLSGVALALVLAGCGEAKKKSPPPPPVRLSVDAPTDRTVLREDSVELHGIVAPANARVQVEGRNVRVRGGRFTTTVQLLPGTNLIDVMAGAPGGARPAMVAVRVQREVTVDVPDLTGVTPGDAKDTLAGLGLEADIQEAGGLLEFLLPEDARVCESEPAPGTSVEPGTTVTVYAAKRC